MEKSSKSKFTTTKIAIFLVVLFCPTLVWTSPVLSDADLQNLSTAELEALLAELSAGDLGDLGLDEDPSALLLEPPAGISSSSAHAHHHHQQHSHDQSPGGASVAAVPPSNDVISDLTRMGPLLASGDASEEAATAFGGPREHHHSASSADAGVRGDASLHVINDCMTVSMNEGIYQYKTAAASEQVCGLYLVAEPDKLIVVTIDYLDVDCARGGLISVVDGWELNGQVFPGVEDHEKSFNSRFHERCGTIRRGEQQRFTSSQNAAVIQYRIPVPGQGFSVRVKHVQNSRPCNILVQDTEGEYTLQNYGKRLNCSLTTIYPAKLRLLYMSTDGRRGTTMNGNGLKLARSGQRGLLHKCEQRGINDYVQIGGSTGLETSKMDIVDDVCGHGGLQSLRPTTIFCGMTTVRLVSSGTFSNKVTVQLRKAQVDDITQADHVCGL